MLRACYRYLTNPMRVFKTVQQARNTYTHIHIYTYKHMYTYTYIRMCTCMYKHIYMYISDRINNDSFYRVMILSTSILTKYIFIWQPRQIDSLQVLLRDFSSLPSHPFLRWSSEASGLNLHLLVVYVLNSKKNRYGKPSSQLSSRRRL
jgi:hypothetical protein